MNVRTILKNFGGWPIQSGSPIFLPAKAYLTFLMCSAIFNVQLDANSPSNLGAGKQYATLNECESTALLVSSAITYVQSTVVFVKFSKEVNSIKLKEVGPFSNAQSELTVSMSGREKLIEGLPTNKNYVVEAPRVYFKLSHSR
jgi:hypothetical protein